MDISEAFRAEDIAKTDFFDFVVAPDVTDANALQQFNRSMKSVGIFLESYNNNNNNSNNNNNNNNNNDNESVGERHKETNNNNLATGFVENNFWNSSTIVGTSSCDKETVRWEPSMLEDLNCWNDEQDNSSASVTSKANPHNTDGAIYTLTVLNGSEQTTTWYRPPEDSANQQKQPQTQAQPPQPSQQQQTEDSETNQRRPSTSAPPPAQPSSIDIESFFNNIPATIEQNQNDAFSSGFQRTQNDANTQQSNLVEVKQEYFDNKKEMCSNIVSEIVLTQAPVVQYNTNNNDWKLQDNNSDRCGNNVESLLRNALQGKTFLSRYNGHIKNEKEDEMKRVLINTKTENVFTPELEEEIKTQSPLMAVSLEGGTVVMFDGGSGNGMLIDSDNPSSAQSMDDIFLSQLDSVPYHEDYEKLKRIENEVAESVEQYCNSGQNIYLPAHLNDPTRSVQPTLIEHHGLLNSIPTTTTAAITSSSQTTKSGSKKYSKRSSTSGIKTQSQLQSAAAGSSSAAGVRKERSLHYCNICSKGFKDKYSVNVHIRTHTGEKPFACSLCGKSFRQKAHLAKHYHTHLTQAKNSSNGSSSASSSTSSSKTTLNKSR